MEGRLTPSIAIAALLLSLVTAYFQHCHVSEVLEVVLLDADPAGGQLVLEAAFVNPGNRVAVVVGIHPHASNRRPNELNAETPLKNIELSTELPLSVRPGEIVTVQVLADLDLRLLYQRSDAPDGGGHDEFDGQATRKVSVRLSIDSMDASGTIFHGRSGSLQMHLTETSIVSWGHDSSKFNLFRDS